jgi:hypothetical protein
LRRNLINRNPCLREKHAGVFDVIHAGWLKVYRLESGFAELRSIVRLFQRSSNAADPKTVAAASEKRGFRQRRPAEDAELAEKTRLQGQFAPFRVRMDNPEITFDTNWPPFAVAPADVTQQGSVIRFFEEASSGKT